MTLPPDHILQDPLVRMAARLGFEGDALRAWCQLPGVRRVQVLKARHRFAGMSEEDADLAARRMETPEEFYAARQKVERDQMDAMSFTFSMYRDQRVLAKQSFNHFVIGSIV